MVDIEHKSLFKTVPVNRWVSFLFLSDRGYRLCEGREEKECKTTNAVTRPPSSQYLNLNGKMVFTNISALHKNVLAAVLGILHKRHAIYSILGKFLTVFVEPGDLLFNVIVKQVSVAFFIIRS